MSVVPPKIFPAHGPGGTSQHAALRAGPLALVFHEGDLRTIKWGDREVLRRIYGAVRDCNWGTVPGILSGLEIRSNDSDFRIRYSREHRENGIHFVWRAEIIGNEDGTLRFDFDGEARTTFLRNRIGLCVLHPIRECAGAHCRALHTGGTTTDLKFPEEVAVEQPIHGFTDLAELQHEVESGVWLEVAFEGDVFETEDQRNWIDASFKTYSTPLRFSFPVEIQAGTRIHQSVTVRLRTAKHARIAGPTGCVQTEPTKIIFGGSQGVRIPEVGLGMASHGEPLSGLAVDRLSRLGLSHLRADLCLSDARWTDRLRIAAKDGMELGTALELAIHLPRIGPGDLDCVARELGRLKVDPIRVLLFRDGSRSTLPEDLAVAQAAFADGSMAIGVGTDADLYQFHLQPPPDGGDFLCWTMNPQVHASDELSIAETPEAVGHQLATLRRRHSGRPLVVSPVTLKPRFNAVATAAAMSASSGQLPPEVDPRQTSLFAAAWTLAMFKALAEGGVHSVTFFETTGWRGVIGTEAGSPLPELFQSPPNCVFPVYHVLEDIGEFAGGIVLPTEATGSHHLASLLLRLGQRRRLILANLGTEPCRVSLENFEGITRSRILDASTREEAMNEPESFRDQPTGFNGGEVELPAYAIVTLDFSEH